MTCKPLTDARAARHLPRRRQARAQLPGAMTLFFCAIASHPAMAESHPSAPAFLHEADARQIINEEFARVGVTFEEDVKTLLPVMGERFTTTYATAPDGSIAPVGTKRESVERIAPLVLDGFDAARSIGYEYISSIDADAARAGGGKDQHLVELADEVAERASSEGLTRVWGFATRTHGESDEALRADLREQVVEFIAWLRKNEAL